MTESMQRGGRTMMRASPSRPAVSSSGAPRVETRLPVPTGREIEQENLLLDELEHLLCILNLLENNFLAGARVDEGEVGMSELGLLLKVGDARLDSEILGLVRLPGEGSTMHIHG